MLQKDTKFILLILFCLIIYCFAWQGVRPLYEPDEGRYTAIADEMIRLGDWIQPRLNHDTPHWAKPPLTYWAIASSILTMGRNEYAARFPIALAFFMTILLVYQFGRIFLDKQPWLAALVYASFALPCISSNMITTDTILTLWETAAVYAFARAMWKPDEQHRMVWVLLMWAFFGLAFMTKGPPGLLPMLAIIAYIFCTPKRFKTCSMMWPLGIIVFLCISAPWFILVISKDPNLVQYFFIEETFKRVFSSQHRRNAHWYGFFSIYLPILLVGTLPWTFFLVRACYQRICTLLKEGLSTVKQWQGMPLFLLLWILCPLFVLSIAKSKLPLYLLPLFVPLSLVVAVHLNKTAFPWTKLRILLVGAWLLFMLLVRLGMPLIPHQSQDIRLLTSLVKNVSANTYAEICFYDTKPIMGLSFYLDKEVKMILNIPNEIHDEEGRVWLVRPYQYIELKTALHASGKKTAFISNFKGLYVLVQEFSLKK